MGCRAWGYKVGGRDDLRPSRAPGLWVGGWGGAVTCSPYRPGGHLAVGSHKKPSLRG